MRTRKPCPGCGKNDRDRRSDSVCSDCANSIKKWPEHVAKVSAKPDQTAVGLKGVYHWYPQFYFSGPRCHINELGEMRTQLSKDFEEIAERLTVERLTWEDSRTLGASEVFIKPDVRYPLKKTDEYAERVPYPASDGQNSYRDMVGLMDTRNLELIRSLWDHTARFADLAYIGGVIDGKNLLLQLSTGEMSAQDFQKKDIELAKKQKDSVYLHQTLKGKKK